MLHLAAGGGAARKVRSSRTLLLIDLFLAGFCLKLGGKLAKGPYLPQTIEGLGKTTKAVLGKK